MAEAEDKPLRVFIQPGSASAEDIAELFAAMSDLYRAMYGEGLEIVGTGSLHKSDTGEVWGIASMLPESVADQV